MTGKQLKKKYPKWVEKHKIQDDDILFLAGEKIRVLKSYKNDQKNKR